MKPVVRNLKVSAREHHLVRARSFRFAFGLAVIAFFFCTAAQANTFHVTTTGDNQDNSNPTAGSLRKAIIDANNNPGKDTIDFSLSGSNVHTFIPTTTLPLISDAVIIDGYTQPGASANTLVNGDNAVLLIEINGAFAGPSADGLRINDGVANCLIRGLVINRFQHAAITIGTGQGNHIIEGNFIGTDAAGAVALGNGNGQGTGGVLVFGANNVIGGTTPQARNIISGSDSFSSSGVELNNSYATGNVVAGNYIGTDKSSLVKLGSYFGVFLNGCVSNTIGGTTLAARNVISGNGTGVLIVLGAKQNQVQGNYIGTDTSLAFAVPNGGGVVLQQSAVNNIIGGITSGSGNVIAANNGNGVAVADGACKNNSILRNSIFANGKLGIDLGFDDVTANDQSDADSGANGLQNYPKINSAVFSGGNTTIQGTLNSTPNTQFNVEIFANAQPDDSGFGEGQTFLGSVNVTTNAIGDANFNAVLAAGQAGQFVSATATDPAGNTSEFSSCVYTISPTAGLVTLSAATYSVNENGGSLLVNVARTAGSAGTVTVKYATSDGTAKAGSAYTSTSGSVTWSNGDLSTKQISIPITDDTIYDPNQTFNLNLSNGSGGAALGSPNSAVVTIVDNDPQPAISISDVTKAEGNSGGTAFVFTLSLSNGSSQSVNVSYANADGTAKAISDFSLQSGTVIFFPGELTKTLTITVFGDTFYEPDETFFVNLSNPVNGTIAKGQGTGTIVNDDAPQPGKLSFGLAAYSVNEGNGSYTIAVNRTFGSNGAISVQYATVTGGTASSADYNTTTGVLNWADGDTTSKTFTITIVDDQLDEADETINITLSSPTNGATVGTPSDTVLTIKDNDSPPKVSVDDVSQVEGNSGTTNFTFNITLSAPSAQNVTVNYTTADNTALTGTDYQSANGVVSFTPGETSKPVTVIVNGDSEVEPNETFMVNLYNLNNAAVGKATGLGTIVNDDSTSNTPTIQFSSAAYSVQEDLGAIAVTVTRTGDTSAAASVDYLSVDGSATQKSDFEYASGTLTFAPGETSKTFALLLNEDAYMEGNETFALTLTNPAGATLGTQSTATVTIVDDLPEPLVNPADDAQAFVYMHYHDFLNREPDAAGLAFWTNEITSCGADANCIEAKRVSVSASFFLSIEFQETAYLLYLMQKESYATMPKYTSFMRDLQEVSRGVIVNAPGWQQKLSDNQQQFADKWINRPEFKAAYDALSNDAYVNALYTNAGIVPPQADKDKLVVALNTSGMNRATVLLQVAADANFRQQEQNAAFVMMEYFGYLRRDPNALPDTDLSGYNFWLNKLNQFGGNYIDAEMIKAFITSFEYRQRFGQ